MSKYNALRPRSCPSCRSIGIPRDGCQDLWHIEIRSVESKQELVAWLRAQIDEDEHRTTNVVGHLLHGGERGFDFYDLPDAVRQYIVRFVPARIDAEVEAKRRILDLHVISARKLDRPPFDAYTGQPQPDEYEVECAVCGWAGDDPTAGCITLRLLALPYADSPGYQEAWRP